MKSRSMSGFDAPYVPGWDCHGLPIEIKVDDAARPQEARDGPARSARGMPQVRAEVSRPAALSSSSESACFGRWDKPYSTMDSAVRERASLETLLRASTRRAWSTRA